ncbi:MAG: dihydroneopterin aldolase [Deferribacteres bacterium]|nr:dihydroneopterin aldolase [candidate division KSB1 bacterium]MCB9503321.1 dihydroneopterin aldolase [Deferribacteres bacterium]
MAANTIRLRNMLFHGYHGVYEEEQEIGQRFEVDVEIFLAEFPQGKSDLLRDTIDMYEVHNAVKDIVVNTRFKLVEALAEYIAEVLLERFAIPEILIRIRKPHSPIKGISEGIEVEIVRKAH